MSSESIHKADVLIVGSGPVGLLMAYQLAKFGCKPYLIEKQDKTTLPCYGRACTLWPRTLEMLDALDLADGLIQQGTMTRNGMHFVDGQRAPGGPIYAHRMDKLGDTFYKFGLHIRQRKIEIHFTTALKKLGVPIHEQNEFLDYTIDHSLDEEYPVQAKVKDLNSNSEYTISAKRLVACDGGSSAVRSCPQTGIEFVGDRTSHRWVRMDAKCITDMPCPRYINTIDSPTHGQVLWCPVDNGLTRVGYVFSPKLSEKYGGLEKITKEIVMAEAKAALAPFSLEFEAIEWWTVYGIGQKMATDFISPNYDNLVFLAGDACHTHSSGSAQGLNTGAQDAMNLGWKLALSVKGMTPPSKSLLVSSYGEERKQIVQQVIDNDKTISMLISGQYPERFKGRTENTHHILTEWFSDSTMQAFTLGIGIRYSESSMNYPRASSKATLNRGERGPDVYLRTVGLDEPVRFLKVLQNTGQFTIVVFAGEPHRTKTGLLEMRKGLLEESCWLQKKPQAFVDCFRWLTIISSNYANSTKETLGMPPPPFNIDFTGATTGSTLEVSNIEGTGTSATMEAGSIGPSFSAISLSDYSTSFVNQGNLYLDSGRAAHDMYGVDISSGAAVIFRPDGYVGAVVGLEELAGPQVGSWIGSLLECPT